MHEENDELSDAETRAHLSAIGDDNEIPGDEILYKRLPTDEKEWLVKDQITGKPVRPTSGAFVPHPDGISVYRNSIMASQDPPLGPADLAVSSTNYILSFTAAQARSISLGIKNDAWPEGIADADHPRNAAHALIVGLEKLGKKEKIRRQKEFSRLDFRFVYP